MQDANDVRVEGERDKQPQYPDSIFSQWSVCRRGTQADSKNVNKDYSLVSLHLACTMPYRHAMQAGCWE